MKRAIVFFVGVVVGGHAVADPYGPFNLQSGKVTKQAQSSSGQSADRPQCYKAEGERFLENSWRFQMISAHGKNADCHIDGTPTRVSVDVTLPNGSKVSMPLVSQFCVRAHAETGSGFTKDVRTAWAECNVSAVTIQFK